MKILIAIDGSKTSWRAIDHVLHREWHLKDQFKIVTVIELPPAQLSSDETLDDYNAHMVAACTLITDKAKLKLKRKFPKNFITSEILFGPAEEQIVSAAWEWSADLIIVGSHGHKDCRRFLENSVAECVTRQAPCSVEVVKEKSELEMQPK